MERQFRQVDIDPAGVSGLDGIDSWEVGGLNIASHVGIARRVNGDAIAPIYASATKVGGIDQRPAIGRQLRYERVQFAATVCCLQWVVGWEIGRTGATGQIYAAGRVYSDAGALGAFNAAAAKVSGIDQRSLG